MASMNKIVFILGTKNVPMTIPEIGNELNEDISDGQKYDRVRNFIYAFHSSFIKSGKRRHYKFVLSAKGKERFERIKDKYDPVTDTFLEL